MSNKMGSINNLFCLFDTSTFDEKDKKLKSIYIKK